MNELLLENIKQWRIKNELLENGNKYTQYLKVVEEIGELGSCINKFKSIDDTEDAIGDIAIALINLCAFLDTDIIKCLNKAYEEIKDRNLTWREGVAIK